MTALAVLAAVALFLVAAGFALMLMGVLRLLDDEINLTSPRDPLAVGALVVVAVILAGFGVGSLLLAGVLVTADFS